MKKEERKKLISVRANDIDDPVMRLVQVIKWIFTLGQLFYACIFCCVLLIPITCFPSYSLFILSDSLLFPLIPSHSLSFSPSILIIM